MCTVRPAGGHSFYLEVYISEPEKVAHNLQIKSCVTHSQLEDMVKQDLYYQKYTLLSMGHADPDHLEAVYTFVNIVNDKT